MSIDDNTVNIKLRPYHHGDLRAALIGEGLRLLTLGKAEELSLRAVARGVGVSATSVYRHFPDKDALMTALAHEGLKMLGAAQRRASDLVGGGEAGFVATGRAYVHFATQHPALFRLIFASPTLGTDGSTERITTSDPGALLMAHAARAAATTGGVAEVNAVRSWALVHGLAMLILDGKIPADADMIDRVIC